jgi:hypothetical protein
MAMKKNEESSKSNPWADHIRKTLGNKAFSGGGTKSPNGKFKTPVRPFKPNGKKPVMRPK